ncbi:hypothetical protein [Nocardia testacea]|uniref:hypothetical protein n=1 Tax=Nocardia testacea TaxID=248551 RepID=UPI003A884A79
MRAALVKEFGPLSALVVEEVPDLVPGPVELDESIVAFLGIGAWNFLTPIEFGDSIHAKYEVRTRRDSADRPDRGVVEFGGTVLDRDGSIVQRDTKTLLVARRNND